MNNKKLGTCFERDYCEELSKQGYWVHFMSPDGRGSQPFDIIAVKNGQAYAIECKTLTSDKNTFTINRLEMNQIFAFEKWMMCGNKEPLIAVKWRDKVILIAYTELATKKKINLEEYQHESKMQF